MIDYSKNLLLFSDSGYTLCNDKFIFMKPKEKLWYLKSIRRTYFDHMKIYKDSMKQTNYKFSKDFYLYLKNRIFTINKLIYYIKAGIDGESRVRNELSYHKNIKTFYNITISDNSTSEECDCIILSRYGVFIVEVKNYGSKGQYDILIDSLGRWYKIENKSKTLLRNAYMQNDRKLGLLESIINPFSVNSIIVIPNDVVSVSNESTQCVVGSSNIYNSIRVGREPSLSSKDLFNIEKTILNSRVNDTIYPMLDYEMEIKHNLKFIENYI